MSTLLPILALGFFLGMRHATDPDHVIAVSTIVARSRTTSSAALVGAVWGIGHTLTIMVVGGGIILLGWVIPARIGLSLELSVGVMLIVLGIMNLTGVLQRVSEARTPPGQPAHVHSHAHSHGDYVHVHMHEHEPEAHPHPAQQTPLGWLDRHVGSLGAYQFVRPLIVGIVHGLAGSAAVALLVLATIKSPSWSLLYLLLFGFGTVVGMMAITMAIALPFAHTEQRFAHLNKGLRIASGVLSLAFGLFVAYRIGFVDGLFSADPRWTPR
jgi:sulfite exporter TauE/SafE